MADTRPPEKRFWKFIVVRPRTRCWLWTGAREEKGYGHFAVNGRPVRAHRFSYEMLVWPIPDGLFVLHRCDQPGCVNPDHLFLGTTDDNMLDMVLKGRSAHGERNANFGKFGPAHPVYGLKVAGTRHHSSDAKAKIAKRSRGEINPAAKLTEAAVLEIRASTLSQNALARLYGVSQATINGILRRRTWRHI